LMVSKVFEIIKCQCMNSIFLLSNSLC
jgi:hypothetical protein